MPDDEINSPIHPEDKSLGNARDGQTDPVAPEPGGSESTPSDNEPRREIVFTDDEGLIIRGDAPNQGEPPHVTPPHVTPTPPTKGDLQNAVDQTKPGQLPPVPRQPGMFNNPENFEDGVNRERERKEREEQNQRDLDRWDELRHHPD